MTVEEATYIGQQALQTSMMLAVPPLLAALITGVAVGIVQTVTQLQEVTLSFIPKMAAVFFTLVVASGWMLQVAIAFGQTMFRSVAETP
jgi:flagellar biosynthetic protein FliQ